MDGGQIAAAALKAQGVTFLYTLVGGHISPILWPRSSGHPRVDAP
ncbi:hypothetical protein [Candidatus Amarolinea dominans]